MENLASKYRPKTFDDITEQKTVTEVLENLAQQDDLSVRNFLFTGPAGTGKALKLDEKILTPDGWKLMKDIHVGQPVYTGTGAVAKVSGVYPQGVRSMYRITLEDRTYLDVSDEHLNVVYRYNEDTKKRQDYCLSTLELIEFFKSSRFKLRVDIPEVDWDYREVPLDPYLLGALIGDGSLSSGNCSFSNCEDDVIEHIREILETKYNHTLRKVPGDNVDWTISPVADNHKYTVLYDSVVYNSIESLSQQLIADGYPKVSADILVRYLTEPNTCIHELVDYPELRDKLKLLNVNTQFCNSSVRRALKSLNLCCKSIDKHIPEIYLHNSRDVRIQLLQGLFDTDGYISKESSTEWYTASPQLSEDFAFLVRSLGIRDTVKVSPAKYKNNDGEYVICNDLYTHYLHIPNELEFCCSKKHRSRRSLRQNPPIRNIVSIEPIESAECQCIYVDHPDHTFIASDFIPTHNTTSARALANRLNNYQGEIIEVDAASHSGVEAVRSIIDQARQFPVGSKYKIFILDEVHAFSTAAWSALLKTLEEQPARTIMCLCTTNPEKIPPTILSRVQSFQLSKISTGGIIARLKHILESEIAEGADITYTDEAVTYIAKISGGGMRDSITNMEQCLTLSHNLTIDTVLSALNLPNYDDYFTLLTAIAKKDNTGIVTMIDNVYNSGANFVKWFEGFHGFICNIVKYIFMQDISATVIPGHYLDKISKYGPAHSALCLKLANKLTQLNNELKNTQYLQELAITYLCTPPTTKKEG